MEDAFDDLLRLIGEATYGQEVGCSVTMKAYARMAEKAARALVAHAVDEDEETRLRRCCAYSERYCFRQPTWDAVINFMNRYWAGVEDGFLEKTQNSHGGKMYLHGYKMGRYKG